jgi:putative sigma-54 modulation protein
MNLTLTGRHFEITPNLKAHVDEKVKKLGRFNSHITEGEIVMFKESVHDVAEGRIHMSHTVLTAKGQGKDMYMAVNDLVDKLVAQLHRQQGKFQSRKRQSPSSPF